jgi:integrase
VTAAAAGGLPAGPGQGREFPHVLAGVQLEDGAAGLAAAIDPAFLAEAGWDPVLRILNLQPGHRLLGDACCKAAGCEAIANRLGACRRCRTRLTADGMTAGQIASADVLPPDQARCAIPGCQQRPGRKGLCDCHRRQREHMNSKPSLEAFLADPRVVPLGPAAGCAVTVCGRTSTRGSAGYQFCEVHYNRWRAAAAAGLVVDARQWLDAEPPVAERGIVSLRELAPLTTVQVLAGLQLRTRDDGRTKASELRAACRYLASQDAASLAACDTTAAGINAGQLLRSLARYARLAVSDPGSEQQRDVWDLPVFGHRGQLDFTGITQPWLREGAKRWAAHDLPRRRGSGAAGVREIINAAARLSESLRARPDCGDQPAALSRRDIENFLARLAYLESAGTISRFRRNLVCCAARTVLTAIRELGLGRPGQPSAGLGGDVTITPADIPRKPEPAAPGRDLPPEIMTALCAALDTLQPEHIKAAVQIAIDTGRRPDEIISLPLDCLAPDAAGAPVLIYANIKAHRDGRRLPVSEHTAAVIAAQQQRVTVRFPATPRNDLVLFPSTHRNPYGHRHISVTHFEEQHRDWITSLGELRTRDGTVFDSARIVLYAYRHTYAQRHADAGVPVDVLAGLLDHQSLDITRGYYRVGEDRHRQAVDKVTAMSFDRHGTRIWRDARALIDAEHARYAIGQIAVPYGSCTEPSNVAAGGGACPVRFRCAGCDHFRTDISYLPDLTAHLDDLLRTRERLAAMTGIDDWARSAAAPAEEEITRIRQLIARIQGDIAQLTDGERAIIDDAVTTIRKHRAVHLGMPAIRTTVTAQEETA